MASVELTEEQINWLLGLVDGNAFKGIENMKKWVALTDTLRAVLPPPQEKKG